jgi:exodeoxyribonuclease VII small subunit
VSETGESGESGPTDPSDTTATETIGYSDALAELDMILGELEDDRIDVDVLATKVRRASVLIELCRSRIEAARIEVTRVVGPDDQPSNTPTS